MLKKLFKSKKYKDETTIKLYQAKIKELEDEIMNYKQRLAGFVSEYVEDKEINIDNFCTKEFKTQFINYIGNEKHSETEVLNKYNELINKEKIYFSGIFDCLDFIITRRNKKQSIEKQIRKYILTTMGNAMVNMKVESILEQKSNDEK